MRILVVCRGINGKISPFVQDQIESLEELGIEIYIFSIEKGGLSYFSHFRPFIDKIQSFKPDLIHAHYGLSGFFANFQRSIPVVTTFHGSDVNIKKVRKLSWITSKLSATNIFVSTDLNKLMPSNNSYIIPCGVDLELFKPRDKSEARKEFGFTSKRYILFSSNFNNKVKNYPLAKSAVELLNDDNIEIVELKGYSREQVAKLMCAVDMVLMTSFTEGSPQFIKEAMACNIPIVSTDVGDVREVIGKTEGCYITSFDTEDVADKIKQALAFGKRTKGIEDIKHLEASVIAKKIINVYNKVLKN